MNRSHYFDYIEDRLSHLATRIEVRGKLNILNLNLHSENFYMDFFNKLFKWELVNLNAIAQNVEAIDLFDSKNTLVVQVSATSSKQKIESALDKDLSKYSKYIFKFISICKDSSDLKSKIYKNPHGLSFDPLNDIHDIPSILKVIIGLAIEEQKPLFDFIKLELGSEPDAEKLESNLATLIDILAQEDWNETNNKLEINAFEVDRKITHNNLKAAKTVIDDYSIHFLRIDKIYTEFNKQGKNKSISVLTAIRHFYTLHRANLSDDALFFKVIESVISKIQSSANYMKMPYEELDLCVNILVVDAFIRCKIFENPMNYSHVAP